MNGGVGWACPVAREGGKRPGLELLDGGISKGPEGEVTATMVQLLVLPEVALPGAKKPQ